MRFWHLFRPSGGAVTTAPTDRGARRRAGGRPAVRQANAAVERRTPTPLVDLLPDEQLAELNRMLDWNCFTVDVHGRRFGKPHGAKKRQEPQPVPDRRIVLMDERFGLADKTVLEVGCFEGIHTVALAQRAKHVIAVDSRIENVVKTMVRVGFFAEQARVICCNLEDLDDQTAALLRADLVHHVGVLYHLQDPVTHLLSLRELAPAGIMLDTHYAAPETATDAYDVGGETYRYFRFKEKGGYAGVFSGMYEHAKWLTLDGLQKALRLAGYDRIELVERRDERNGPRLLLFASPS